MSIHNHKYLFAFFPWLKVFSDYFWKKFSKTRKMFKFRSVLKESCNEDQNTNTKIHIKLAIRTDKPRATKTIPFVELCSSNFQRLQAHQLVVILRSTGHRCWSKETRHSSKQLQKALEDHVIWSSLIHLEWSAIFERNVRRKIINYIYKYKQVGSPNLFR